jgi:hypothetical protein
MVFGCWRSDDFAGRVRRTNSISSKNVKNFNFYRRVFSGYEKRQSRKN